MSNLATIPHAAKPPRRYGVVLFGPLTPETEEMMPTLAIERIYTDSLERALAAGKEHEAKATGNASTVYDLCCEPPWLVSAGAGDGPHPAPEVERVVIVDGSECAPPFQARWDAASQWRIAKGEHRRRNRPRRAVTVSAPDRAEFEAYVWEYYADDWAGWGHHPDPITKLEIAEATDLLLAQYAFADDTHPLGHCSRKLRFDGGSHAREVAANIILHRRGVPLADLEHGVVVGAMMRGAAE